MRVVWSGSSVAGIPARSRNAPLCALAANTLLPALAVIHCLPVMRSAGGLSVPTNIMLVHCLYLLLYFLTWHILPNKML